jgi:hypothetical protein
MISSPELRNNMTIRDCAQRVDALVKAKQLHKAVKDGSLSDVLDSLRIGLSAKEMKERALSLATLAARGASLDS